jgi:hypothetical protein
MDNWEMRFKACTALAAVCSASSLVIGGCVGLYTYQKQAEASRQLKVKELLQIEYAQKRDIYYELVDAAAAFASSPDLETAQSNAARYWKIYLGRAHIVVTEDPVIRAKIDFGQFMKAALQQGTFPNNTKELKNATLALSDACKEALVPDAFFGEQKFAKRLQD